MEEVTIALFLKLKAANKMNDVTTKLVASYTDEERVIFILKCMLEHNTIPDITSYSKSAKESQELRGMANKIYASSTLTQNTSIQILQLYTRSIKNAPNQSEELATSYGNRSLILFKLHEYKKCIEDINRALTITNSDSLRIKLYLRKVECLCVLNYDVDGIIKEVQCSLNKMSLDDDYRKKVNEKLLCTNSMSTPYKRKPKKYHRSPLPTLQSCNVEIPCASDAVSLKYDEEYGRHVVANRNLSPGEIIVIEKPYLSLLSPDNINTHCSYCLEVCWALIPCTQCTYAGYCSEKCRIAEWEKYHDMECAVIPLMLKMKFTKLDIFTLRLAIVAVKEATSIQDLRKEVEEVDNCKDPRTKGFSKNGILVCDKFRSLLGLVTNTEKRSRDNLFRRSVDSCYTLYYLATCSNIFGDIREKDLSKLIENSDATFVGGLLLRNQQMIPTNCHNIDEERNLGFVQRGMVLLPFLSLMNHSCSPNIVRQSKRGHVIVYVLQPIKEGEQIFDNYGQLFAMAPLYIRQRELLKQYHFICNCIACQEDWPLYTQMQSYRNLVHNKTHLNTIQHALRNFNKYFKRVSEGNISDKHILQYLLKMIEVLCKYVRYPCVELCEIIETVKRIYDLNGNQFIVPQLTCS